MSDWPGVGRRKVIWFLTRGLVENWEIDEDRYHLIDEGEPGGDMRIHVTDPVAPTGGEWDAGWTTAMPTVNALFQLKEARSGILDPGIPRLPSDALSHPENVIRCIQKPRVRI